MSLCTLSPTILGKHIIAEFWGCERIDEPAYIEAALIEAAKKAGATVITTKFHHFGAGMGVTGVVVLAESHISIHSWPEFSFAAVDVFVCGKANPNLAIESMISTFSPKSTEVLECYRGGKQNAG